MDRIFGRAKPLFGPTGELLEAKVLGRREKK